MRLALRGVPLIVVALCSASARAQDPDIYAKQRDDQDRVIRMNREALEDVDNLEWDSAKKKLLSALIVAKKAGLEQHPIMARTYVHLGIVYVSGFKNREKAFQCFVRALETRPDIKLSPAMVTAEVNEIFAAASRRELPPTTVLADNRGEPELPWRVNALDCFYPEVTRVDQAVPARCAVAPKLPVTKVFLFYRDPAKNGFFEIEMKRTPKGWFQGRVPERVIYQKSVQLYFEGRDETGKPIVRNGQEDSPNVILVVKR